MLISFVCYSIFVFSHFIVFLSCISLYLSVFRFYFLLFSCIHSYGRNFHLPGPFRPRVYQLNSHCNPSAFTHEMLLCSFIYFFHHQMRRKLIENKWNIFSPESIPFQTYNCKDLDLLFLNKKKKDSIRLVSIRFHSYDMWRQNEFYLSGRRGGEGRGGSGIFKERHCSLIIPFPRVSQMLYNEKQTRKINRVI